MDEKWYWCLLLWRAGAVTFSDSIAVCFWLILPTFINISIKALRFKWHWKSPTLQTHTDLDVCFCHMTAFIWGHDIVTSALGLRFNFYIYGEYIDYKKNIRIVIIIIITLKTEWLWFFFSFINWKVCWLLIIIIINYFSYIYRKIAQFIQFVLSGTRELRLEAGYFFVIYFKIYILSNYIKNCNKTVYFSPTRLHLLLDLNY